MNHPTHYATVFPLETIEIIKIVLQACPKLTPFEAYCLGNELKYRMRAGLKGDPLEDIGKAMKYKDFRKGV